MELSLIIFNSLAYIILLILLARHLIGQKTTTKPEAERLEQQSSTHFLEKHERWILFILVVIGSVVRIIYFGTIPPGLNQDEASIGYDAFALLNYGIDRNGYHNPIYLVGWGSGQNALYAYLVMPLISLLGLNSTVVRLPSLIFAIISIPVFYLLVKKAWNIGGAFLALSLLIINPWHIMLSRWGLESNLLPALFLFGVYFLILSLEKSTYFVISMITFGIALYSYAVSYLVIPMFLSLTFIYILKSDKINKFKGKHLVIGIVAILLLALPLIIFILINVGLIAEIRTNLISIPLMPAYRGSEINLSMIPQNISYFTNIYIIQNDGCIWNSIGYFGYIYLFSTPFILVGLAYSLVKLRKNLKNNEFDTSAIFIIWLLSSYLTTFLISSNFTRANTIFLPSIYFCAVGIGYLVRSRATKKILTAMYIMAFSLFTYYYLLYYPQQIGPAFYESLDQTIDFACKKTDSTIYVSEKISLAYIHILFDQGIPPANFMATVVYNDPKGQYRETEKFDRFIFHIPAGNKFQNAVYLVENKDIEEFILQGFNIETFKYYSIAY